MDENKKRNYFNISIIILMYTQLVFPKRAAMLLDRLMVALHHALEDDDPKQLQKINEMYRHSQMPSVTQLPHKPNIQPKYYKGKTDSDAYYGYKLVNGQAGDFPIHLI